MAAMPTFRSRLLAFPALLSLFALILSMLPARASEQCGIIGGGPGYASRVDKADAPYAEAHDYAELVRLLTAGQRRIYSSEATTIEIPTQARGLVIPDDVTLFGDRGLDTGSKGGTLHVGYANNDPHSYPVIEVGNRVRFSGLRIVGPTRDRNTANVTTGIQQRAGANGLEVDNSELSDWPGAAISLRSAQGGQVHHNYIHHNQRRGLGYGVVIQDGNASVHVYCNVFDYNRHSIAASGRPGERYYAQANLILPNAWGESFDMHPNPEQVNAPANTRIGGEEVIIRDNWFVFSGAPDVYAPIYLRAPPSSGPATIDGNHFRAPMDWIDWLTKRRRAVLGPGAVPNDASLGDNNSFEETFNYNRDEAGHCNLVTASGLQNVNCDALRAYIH